MRIFISGPYGAGNPKDMIARNVARAVNVGHELMALGHQVFVPHSMTHTWEDDPRLTNEQILDLCKSFLSFWAEAIYRIPGESPGADGEVALARELDLMVIEEALSRECDGLLAINHAACTQGPIFQAWDGKDIFCPCACHLDNMSASVISGFIASVLQLRAVMSEVGMIIPHGKYWDEVAEWVYGDKELPDGRHAWVVPRLLGQGGIIAGKNRINETIDEGWDYETLDAALKAFGEYDGTVEPEGWVRHTPSFRRRPGGDATKEYIHG